MSKRYILLKWADWRELEKEITNYLNKGWELHGPTIILPGLGSDPLSYTYMQPMTINAPKPKKGDNHE
jgi:hypothetical protein